MTTEARTQRYVFERELGRGGFGSVVLATDSLLGRRVALKSLSGQDAGALAGEARVLAALRHPNIVQVYDLAEIAGVPYLVLQYVTGRSLRSHLESGPLPPERAVSYAVSIAAALAYVHQKGVVHNDVKPDNIMIGDDDEALLTDFGVASSPQSATLLPGEAGSIAGSLPYIAPEVIQGAAPSPRSDLYALAATLYEMLSGLPPFSGAGAAGMAQRLAGPPPRLTIRDSDWGALPVVLERALAPSAADRYQDAAEFAAALARPSNRTMRLVPVVPPLGSPVRPIGGAPPPRSKIAAGVAFAVVGLALLGAASVFASRQSDNAGTVGGPGGIRELALQTPLAATPRPPPASPSKQSGVFPGLAEGKAAEQKREEQKKADERRREAQKKADEQKKDGKDD
ncbi:MAG: serine/threonine-protein kinase [Tepidiformaceae bacterium]